MDDLPAAALGKIPGGDGADEPASGSGPGRETPARLRS